MDSREFRDEDRKRMDVSIQRLDERYLKIRNILGAIRHAADKDAANRVLNENLAVESGDGLWQLTSQMLQTLEKFVAFDMKGLVATENGDKSELVIEADNKDREIADSNEKQQSIKSKDLNEDAKSTPSNKIQIVDTKKIETRSQLTVRRMSPRWSKGKVKRYLDTSSLK